MSQTLKRPLEEDVAGPSVDEPLAKKARAEEKEVAPVIAETAWLEKRVLFIFVNEQHDTYACAWYHATTPHATEIESYIDKAVTVDIEEAERLDGSCLGDLVMLMESASFSEENRDVASWAHIHAEVPLSLLTKPMAYFGRWDVIGEAALFPTAACDRVYFKLN